MRALVMLQVLCAAAPVVAVAAGRPGRASGWVSADGVTIEVRPPAPPPGRVVRLPEGWYRIEEADPDSDAEPGFFAVVAERPRAPAGPAAPAPPAVTPPPPQGAPPPTAPRAAPPEVAPAAPCEAEREAYLDQLLRTQGIRVDRPLALVEGLAGPGASPATAFSPYGLPSIADALRPLAWDFTLRERARELVECLRGPDRWWEAYDHARAGATQPNTARTTSTDAANPTRSAISAAGSAWR